MIRWCVVRIASIRSNERSACCRICETRESVSELRREAIHFKRLATLLIARIRQSLVRLDFTVRHQTE